MLQQNFSQGAFRSVAYARMPDGQRMVAKRILRERSRLESNVRELEGDLRASLLAQKVAAAFNDPEARGSSISAGTVHYPAGSILIISEAQVLGGQAAHLVEPYLQRTSRWQKWINNDGSLATACGEPDVPEVLSAFCHFSLIHLAETEALPHMILDIQGLQPDTNSLYHLTDPAISTQDPNVSQYYGETNLGRSAMYNFLAHHQCGSTCISLGLDNNIRTARALDLTQAEVDHIEDLVAFE
ncbi:hypothetical protein WJX74_010983 [Apatococcus lobatus]|uniref:Alpha-type protein kinase domain-containing protein n=2 Tax=Apatococcus TaxID=904362 RepID=A0AAW1T0X1_9CHLO